MIVPIFLTGLGCSKNPCVFCDQEIASSRSFVNTDEAVKGRIEETLTQYLEPLRDGINGSTEIAFYGSNFTALDFTYQKELLKFIQETFEKVT
ncbi:MAG: radical SAM protein, partial [Pseudomonadota bacterium]